MKVKLSIIIFTVILSVFYLQMVSCKKNPEEPEPVYSNYTGLLNLGIKAEGDIVPKNFYDFSSIEGGEYVIVDKSDIDKLATYITEIITIKAIYSNHYKGYRRLPGLPSNFLYDVTVIE